MHSVAADKFGFGGNTGRENLFTGWVINGCGILCATNRSCGQGNDKDSFFHVIHNSGPPLLFVIYHLTAEFRNLRGHHLVAH